MTRLTADASCFEATMADNVAHVVAQLPLRTRDDTLSSSDIDCILGKFVYSSFFCVLLKYLITIDLDLMEVIEIKWKPSPCSLGGSDRRLGCRSWLFLSASSRLL